MCKGSILTWHVQLTSHKCADHCCCFYQESVYFIKKKSSIDGRLILFQNCKTKNPTLQGVASWEGEGVHVPKINGGGAWLSVGAQRIMAFHVRRSMIWRWGGGRIKSLHISPKLTQKKNLFFFFFLQSNFHGGTWRAPPYRGGGTGSVTTFLGQPKMCPFLTLNTLHNVRWKKCPPWLKLSAPLVLCPPPPPPPPPAEKCPGDRNWVLL